MKHFSHYASQAAVLALFVISYTSVQAAAYEDLLRAAEIGDAKGVDQMIGKGMDPNTADAKGNTLLIIAVREGHRDVVGALVRRKANANKRNQYGDSALMLASLRGDREIARMLIELGGAEVKHSGWAPIHYAAFYDKPEMIRYLIAKGADKDALAPNGYTPLMLSARSGHTDAARALLQEDVDINLRNPDGQTALKIARQRKHGEVAELIVRAGGVE
jgi:ankyrin repeat protein